MCEEHGGEDTRRAVMGEDVGGRQRRAEADAHGDVMVGGQKDLEQGGQTLALVEGAPQVGQRMAQGGPRGRR